ncbi:MAG: alcohol dehydrogenase catalytic domain-containing protein [Candidatus Hodarchaeota archaeon]
MRVAMHYSNDDVRLEDMSIPQIGPEELLVKVIASGICGSDAMEWYRIRKAPLVLGHEITGEIAEIGSGVKKYKKGDRVFVSHHVPCNTCRYCVNDHHTACETLHQTNYYPGGFAEYPDKIHNIMHELPRCKTLTEAYRGTNATKTKERELVKALYGIMIRKH